MTATLELVIRISAAVGVFAAMALWEWAAPRRHLAAGRRPRWPGNLGILAIDIVAVRLLVPMSAVGAALVASEKGGACFSCWDFPAGRPLSSA